MRKQTLLFVFVHGFKGDNETFAEFPHHLQQLLQVARPEMIVKIVIYPQFETRGDLGACVSRFHSWLQNTVIDIEAANSTPHPTVSPSVHTVLVGHSMGGIVCADALLSILDDQPVRGESSMFPHVVGVLAFDTPYLGLAPSMFAHGAGEKWKGATAAFSTLSSVTSGLFANATAQQAASAKAESEGAARRKRDEDEKKKQQSSGAGGGGWGWGTVAALAGGAVALGGGAAAAYWGREELGAGFNWVSSHLEFAGALMRGEELRLRVDRVSTTPGVGFANLFTSLGTEKLGTLSVFDGKERTFCSIPDDHSVLRKKFYRCVNPKADDEVGAHVSMFRGSTNPNHYELVDRAKNLVMVWVPENQYPPIDEMEEYIRQRGGKPPSPRRSSTYDKPPKPERRDSTRPEKERDREISRSERRTSIRTGELERRESIDSRRSSGAKDIYDERPNSERRDSTRVERRSSSKDLYDDRPIPERRGSSRTHSIHESTSVKEERRGSKPSSRTQTPDIERVKLERKGSGSGRSKSSKSSKSGKSSSGTVDLEHNPWR